MKTMILIAAVLLFSACGKQSYDLAPNTTQCVQTFTLVDATSATITYTFTGTGKDKTALSCAATSPGLTVNCNANSPFTVYLNDHASNLNVLGFSRANGATCQTTN